MVFLKENKEIFCGRFMFVKINIEIDYLMCI